MLHGAAGESGSGTKVMDTGWKFEVWTSGPRRVGHNSRLASAISGHRTIIHRKIRVCICLNSSDTRARIPKDQGSGLNHMRVKRSKVDSAEVRLAKDLVTVRRRTQLHHGSATLGVYAYPNIFASRSFLRVTCAYDHGS